MIYGKYKMTSIMLHAAISGHKQFTIQNMGFILDIIFILR